MFKKLLILVAALVICIGTLSGCDTVFNFLDMGEGRVARVLSKKYPDAFGEYQYMGYTFTALEEESTETPPNGGKGFDPEDILDSEYSEFQQQEIYDFIVSALDFTGREIRFTERKFVLKEKMITEYFTAVPKNLSETGYELPWFYNTIFDEVEGRIKFEYDSANEESMICISFFLYDLDINLTLLFIHYF